MAVSITDVLAILSFLLSGMALYVAFNRGEKTLQSTAADRALQRFNRINEKLLEKPHLNKVFKEKFVDLKNNQEAQVFIWYLFNQIEGTFLDRKLGILKEEYFRSYDQWLNDALSQPNALSDFLKKGRDSSSKIKDSFSDSYWQYLLGKIEHHVSVPDEFVTVTKKTDITENTDRR